MKQQMAQKKQAEHQQGAAQCAAKSLLSAHVSTNPLLELHQTIGNHSFLRHYPNVIQTKFRIGSPGDKYEREADRVAEQVMRMPEPILQRKADLEEKGKLAQAKPFEGQITPLIQRQVEEGIGEEEENEGELIQAKVVSDRPNRMLENIFNLRAQLATIRGVGQSLPESVRGFFEPRFGGYEFNQVRIHNDTQATEIAKVLNARAFTVGRDIVFAAGQYAPATKTGQKLLAHELTHVLQQNSEGRCVIRRQGTGLTTSRKAVAYPPVYWSIDPVTKNTVLIPKEGVSLEDIAQYLYGTTAAALDLALENGLNVQAPLKTGHPLRLTGGELSRIAAKDANTSTTVPLGTTDPQAFVKRKHVLDQQLERDFLFVIGKLDEFYYSDSDEGEVIEVFRKWGKETFTTRPDIYPNGGDYLDKLFKKLIMKNKGDGQKLSYYSVIFNKFDRVGEVRKIRDQFSKLFKGEEGTKEVSFTEEFKTGQWKETTKTFWGGKFKALGQYLQKIGTPAIVQNLLGGVVGAIIGFGKLVYELGEGIWSLAVALDHIKASILYFVTGAIEGTGMNFLKRLPFVGKIFDPKTYESKYQKTTEFFRAIGDALKDPSQIWQGIKDAASKAWENVLDEYNKADEFNKSRIIAEGVVKVGMAIGGFIKSLPQLAKSTAKIATTVAKAIVTVTKIIAKGIKGAIRTAKGIVRGTWEVMQLTLKSGEKRLKYLFRKGGGKADVEIPPQEARKYIKCSHCKLTDEGKTISESSKVQAPSTTDTLPSFTRVGFGDKQRVELIKYWEGKLARARSLKRKQEYHQYIETLLKRKRPAWKQSQMEMEYFYRQIGATGEKGYKYGRRSRWKFTKKGPRPEKGSTRPDIVHSTGMIEVKNYKITNTSQLIATLKKQIRARYIHSPFNIKHQSIILDLRGQKALPHEIKSLVRKISVETSVPQDQIQIVTW
ncbi:MAG: DUF4157 domain-containing protein [Anaerolineae bacterium]|nr:DUF4157 domain-containing protein [Anaerolineae bacterium]